VRRADQLLMSGNTQYLFWWLKLVFYNKGGQDSSLACTVGKSMNPNNFKIWLFGIAFAPILSWMWPRFYFCFQMASSKPLIFAFGWQAAHHWDSSTTELKTALSASKLLSGQLLVFFSRNSSVVIFWFWFYHLEAWCTFPSKWSFVWLRFFAILPANKTVKPLLEK